MTHARKQIRDAVAGRLAGLPITGARVYPAKRYSWQAEEMPGLAVYSDADTVDYRSRDREQTVSLTLVVEIAIAAADTVEDDLDEACLQVETALAADPTLDGLVWDLRRSAMNTDTAMDGETPVGIRRLSYAIEYTTPEAAPQGYVWQGP